MKKIISKAKEYAFVIVLGAVLALDYRLFIVETTLRRQALTASLR